MPGGASEKLSSMSKTDADNNIREQKQEQEVQKQEQAAMQKPVTICCRQSSDSVLVEKLLDDYAMTDKAMNPMIFFGNHFKGTPYVASTLEINSTEQLVVNLHELDCTTFVETVFALASCAMRGETSFRDYCKHLQAIRYCNGIVDYQQRNHYFINWMSNNQANGYVKIITSDVAPFTAVAKKQIDYMSTHSSSYSMLAAHPEWLTEIRNQEKKLSGKPFRYIPKTAIDNSQLLRNIIHTGDILAIITNKKGLDTSHIGIAVWQKDGLHLLNASQIHKKVVLEPMLLQTYMKKHPSQEGISVCRVVNIEKNH